MQQVCEFKKSFEKRLGSHCMKRLIPVLTESPMATLHRSMLLLASRAKSFVHPIIVVTSTVAHHQRPCTTIEAASFSSPLCGHGVQGEHAREARLQQRRTAFATSFNSTCACSTLAAFLRLGRWHTETDRRNVRGAVCSKTHSSKMHR